MKCGLFNDPFDYYGHIGSGNGNRLHKHFGERPWGVGWVGDETKKDDTFLRSARNPWTAMSGTWTTNLQIYSSARYRRANPTPTRNSGQNLLPITLLHTASKFAIRCCGAIIYMYTDIKNILYTLTVSSLSQAAQFINPSTTAICSKQNDFYFIV